MHFEIGSSSDLVLEGGGLFQTPRSQPVVAQLSLARKSQPGWWVQIVGLRSDRPGSGHSLRNQVVA
eukprot:1045146-Prorocentrum_lima.AAC.1